MEYYEVYVHFFFVVMLIIVDVYWCLCDVDHNCCLKYLYGYYLQYQKYFTWNVIKRENSVSSWIYV